MVKAATAVLGGAAIGGTLQSKPAAADVPPGSVTLQSFHDEAKDPAPNEAGARSLGTGPNQAAPGSALADKAARAGDTFTGPITVDPPGFGVSTASQTGFLHHATDASGPAAVIGSVWGVPVLGLNGSILTSMSAGVFRSLNTGTPEHADDLITKSYVDQLEDAVATLTDRLNDLQTTADDLSANAPWNLVRSYGVKGDNSTDDTAALQAMFDDLGRPWHGITGGYVEIPPGEYLISDTIVLHRWGGTVAGPGVNHQPGYNSNSSGRGVVFRWIGPAGKPMFQVTDSRSLKFTGLRFEGNNANIPSAGIDFHQLPTAGAGTNGHLVVEDCHFGVWPWARGGTTHGVLSNGISFTGRNGDNDQFRIVRCTFSGPSDPDFAHARAVYLPNTQSVWGSLYDCEFNRMTVGIETLASTTLFNAQFNRCGTDIEVDSTGRVDVFGWQSEHSRLYAKVGPYATLRARGGMWLVSPDMQTREVMVDAFPSTGGQTVTLSDMTVFWHGGAIPENPPTIRFGPHGTATSRGQGFLIKIDDVQGLHAEQAELAGLMTTHSESRGIVQWSSRAAGQNRFRNVLSAGGRTTLDTSVWENHSI